MNPAEAAMTAHAIAPRLPLHSAPAANAPNGTPEDAYLSGRACFICDRYGQCAHRELDVVLAEGERIRRRRAGVPLGARRVG